MIKRKLDVSRRSRLRINVSRIQGLSASQNEFLTSTGYTALFWVRGVVQRMLTNGTLSKPWVCQMIPLVQSEGLTYGPQTQGRQLPIFS